MAEWKLVLGSHQLTVQGFREDRVRKVAKILTVGSHTYAVNDKGEMFASAVRGNSFIVHHNHQTVGILDAAAKFGLLPAAAVKKLKAEHDRRSRISKQYWAARDLRDGAKEMDAQLPPVLKRRITRAFSNYKEARRAT